MFSGRRWLLQHHHRRLGLWVRIDCRRFNIWGFRRSECVRRVFPVVLDEISRLFSMKLSVEKLGDEDGYGVLLRRLPAKLVAFLHLLRLTLTCGVPMA
ncbi:hypothetical protein YC2023_039328 [Brassica napus]